MIQICNISKYYQTGDIVTKALDGVSLNLRDSEFVSVLGVSGSGKSTLLNVIGGLDRYSSGDIIVNGVSTKKYYSRDWDTYRNHTVGFVFQNYNLIQHQTVLSNVELALTISGISKSETNRRAKEALEQVGLSEHIHKKPSQLSGGQMQRVAIARALVNDPDIVLADEPTGALDSVTSVQIMEILKKISEERLVVMVTHNSNLAEKYSTRIVKLSDGKIVGDSQPYELEENVEKTEHHKKTKVKKSKMSFFTSLGLSFNNLRTKIGRTVLTSLAGSIGIIGIALIMAISNGVQGFVGQFEKDTAGSLPITIDEKTADFNSALSAAANSANRAVQREESLENATGVKVNFDSIEMSENSTTGIIKKNDMKAFKQYLDDDSSEIYSSGLSKNNIVYNYNTPFTVYSYDNKGNIVDSNISPDEVINANKAKTSVANQSLSSNNKTTTTPNTAGNSGLFFKILPGSNQKLVSDVLEDETQCCKLLYGNLPKSDKDLLLVLNQDGTLPVDTLYRLGFISTAEYRGYIEKVKAGNQLDDVDISYEDICKKEFSLVPACDQYRDAGNGVYSYIDSTDTKAYQDMVANAIKLHISGIVRKTGQSSTILNTGVGFTSALTDTMIQHTNSSAVVNAQVSNPSVNVLTGFEFANLSDDQKEAVVKQFFMKSGASPTDTASLDKATLVSFYDNNFGGFSYETNLENFGKVDYSKPQSVNIYSDNLNQKNSIKKSIDNYNAKHEDPKDKITYFDSVAFISDTLGTTVNVIQSVMIAIAAISLVVSAIMIGIITHISVLERTKEIGILRALGASKKNVTRVFTAETFLVGLLSGIVGILIALLLILPMNAIFAAMNLTGFTVGLPVLYGIILIAISTVITVIGGIIPAKKAATLDPVVALRSE